MTEKFIAIVLGIRRHNDRHNIVTVYSRSRGRIVFLSPCGTGKAAKMRQSRLQPLAVIEGDMRFSQTTEFQKLTSFSLHEVWRTIYFHPVKRMMALFLSEFLNRLLAASMPDANMWDYIHRSLRLLDETETGIADYHIAFLASLLPFAGIQPDITSYAPGMVFDMQAGMFADRAIPGHECLAGDEARLAAMISRVNFWNVKALRLNGSLRRRILENMLGYYSIHFPGAGNLKSLDVIHEVFS